MTATTITTTILRTAAMVAAAATLAACVGKGPGGVAPGANLGLPQGNGQFVGPVQDNPPVNTNRFANNEQLLTVVQQQNCFNPPAANGRLGNLVCEPVVIPAR